MSHSRKVGLASFTAADKRDLYGASIFSKIFTGSRKGGDAAQEEREKESRDERGLNVG